MQTKWKILIAIFTLVVFADQATKFLAVKHLTYGFDVAGAKTLPAQIGAFYSDQDLLDHHLSAEPVYVARNFWAFRYAQNRGAAWGLLATLPAGARVPFFHIVSIVAVIFILSYVRKLQPEQRYLQVAFSLVLGGAVGNFIDRLARGYVIDFIDWYWHDPQFLAYTRHWPTFNVADSAISVGVVLLLLESFLSKKHAPDPKLQTRTKVA